MAPSPKKNQTNNKPAPKADMVAPERLIVMRPLSFNRAVNAAPDPKAVQQRLQAQASTQALADAFSACSDDDSSGIDMAAVAKALKGGANINAAVNELGQTALHIAVNENDHALAAQLLRAGANTRARDYAGLTPLILSIREGDEGMSGMLARAEEKPQAQVLEGRHAIHDAAKHGHIEALEALIARGLSPTIRDVDDDSPLMEALKAENAGAIFALAYAGGLQASMLKQYKAAFDGAGFDHPEYDMDAFLKAALAAEPPALKPQAQSLPPALGAREEELFLHIATREPGSVSPILKKRPDLNARNAAGDTPLIAAVRRDVLGVADALAPKSDVKAAGAFGRTALHYAVVKTSWDSVTLARNLIDLGANINAQDARGQTPLMLAVYAGAEDNIRMLLEKGAKLDIRDKLGFTVLNHTALTRDSDIIAMIDQAAIKKRIVAKAKEAKATFKATAAKQVKSAAKAPAKKAAAKKPLAKQAGSRYRY